MFDSYPRLIAAFRALHSLLMPRHPPCALCSLTTRIERSSAPPLAGRSGETLESYALPWISDQVRCGIPPEPATPRINDFFSLIALGERFQDVLAHASSAFFQDANYHDQIVKERKRTGATGAASGPHSMSDQASRIRENQHRQSRLGKLAVRREAVKRLEKPATFGHARRPGRPAARWAAAGTI